MGPQTQNPLWGPDWPQVRAMWPIDPAIAHLNHGSFGAVPVPVIEAQDRWRRKMESNPTGFFWWVLPDALEEARRATAGFLEADPDGFVFVANATTAVNTVLRSVGLRRGDQVLLSDHGYGAIRLAAERACELTGAEVVVQPVPLPRGGPNELTDAFLAGVTERTRIAVVDHIASPTAMVFPVGHIVRRLREVGVLSFVDGAHAPGMVDVNLRSLAPDFWTGNFHKWCCAPRGAAGLYVAPEQRERIVPLVTSWNAPEGFVSSFSYLGTDDYTPYLTVPTAIEFMGTLGWGRVRTHNRALSRMGGDIVREAIDSKPGWSVDEGLFEAMTIVALPGTAVRTMAEGKGVSRRLAERFGIEAAVFPWRERGFLRLSAQAYNAPAEYERLAHALREVLPGS